MLIPLILVSIIIGILRIRGKRLTFEGYICILGIVGIVTACPATYVGANVSIKTVEIERVELLHFGDEETPRGDKVYIFDKQRISRFNNHIISSYWIRILGPDGKVKEIQAPGPNWNVERCNNLETQPDPPVMITYRTELLYPGMKPWILWGSKEFRCVSGDHRLMTGIREPR